MLKTPFFVYALREVVKNNLPILLVLLSVFCVATMDEYVQYSSIVAP